IERACHPRTMRSPMALRWWLSRFTRCWLGLRGPTRSFRARLPLEVLEDRLAPAAFTVTDTKDDPTDSGSLRYAITHLASRDNSITCDPSRAGQTIKLPGGELKISQSATIPSIPGLGADQPAISGNPASRVFDITAGTVSISGLTIENGSALLGGGISNQG